MTERNALHSEPLIDLPQGAALKVLVAEDDPSLRMILARRLSRAVNLRLAADGAEAWALCQADPPDLLLSDWMMPNVNGLDLCRLVKRAPGFCYVILMTARGDLEDKVGALECGADEYLVKPVDPRELWARIRAGARIVASNRALAAENRTDVLTGLKNRRAFEEALPREIARADRTGKSFCLVLGDLDRFKAVNDVYGHQIGDQVLAAVGSALERMLRKFDLVFRLGGDEFGVILSECPREGGLQYLARMRDAVAAVRVAEMREPVTISLGLAVFDPSRPISMEDLIRRADERMYRDKGITRARE